MKEEGFGYKQWTLISKRAVTLTCFAFVDDTDLIHAETAHDASTEDLLISAQDALTTWEGLITSTGGALAPEKVIGIYLTWSGATDTGATGTPSKKKT